MERRRRFFGASGEEKSYEKHAYDVHDGMGTGCMVEVCFALGARRRWLMEWGAGK